MELSTSRNLISAERLNRQHAPVYLKKSFDDNALTIILTPIVAENHQGKVMIRVRPIIAKCRASLLIGQIVAVGSFELTGNKVPNAVCSIQAGHCMGAEGRINDVGGCNHCLKGSGSIGDL